VKSCSTLKNKNKITSIAIGGFDGMHIAHQTLFGKLDKNGAIVVIETGYANLSPNTYREEYTSYPIYYYPLEDIKHLNGKQFITLLKDEYPSLKKIVVGYDFYFGANRKYSTKNLKELFSGEVIVVDEVSFEGINIHSRVIRSYLCDGKIEQANKFLNREYKISGYQIKGQGLGTKQFVSTINLKCDDFLLPSSGIYATKTIINTKEYKSITFIGHRLTTDGKFAIETHIIAPLFQNTNLKARELVQIKFFTKIRDNKKFDRYEALQQQILDDIARCKNILI